MEIRVKDLYIKLILLFPLTTLFQSYLGPINKVLFGGLIVMQVFLFVCDERIPIKSAKLFLVAILLHLWALALTGLSFYNLNDVFYLFFMLLYFEYYGTKGDLLSALKENKAWIDLVLWVWNVAVAISLCIPSCYEKIWGGSWYFVSFSGDSFRLAPSATFMLILSLYSMLQQGNRRYFWFSVLPMVCFFLCGTRTYLLVGGLVFLLVWYVYLVNKIIFWRSLLPLFVVGVVLVLVTAIGDKLSATAYTSSSYWDFWGTVTNTRSIFWMADLKAWVAEPLPKILFGCGFNFVYEVNYTAVGAYIWGHNDMIQLLTTFGIVGAGLYFVVMWRCIRVIFRSKGKNSRFLQLIVLTIWLFNAFWNMFYTYFCVVLSFQILVQIIPLAWESQGHPAQGDLQCKT